jgi:menaquinol-cytochrome c reductase iron-sulfur subunit
MCSLDHSNCVPPLPALVPWPFLMNRRSLLKVVSGAMAAMSACIVGIPGVGYVVATVRGGTSNGKTVQRVIRLKDLPVGRPIEMPITGRRHDAWTAYEKETIGRVWLLRTAAQPDQPAANEKVEALSTLCPHLGCAVKLSASKKSFVCPCHQAGFDLAGRKLNQRDLGHKNPSPRDLDALECRIVQDDAGESWVEVTYERFQRGLTAKVSQG